MALNQKLTNCIVKHFLRNPYEIHMWVLEAEIGEIGVNLGPNPVLIEVKGKSLNEFSGSSSRPGIPIRNGI